MTKYFLYILFAALLVVSCGKPQHSPGDGRVIAVSLYPVRDIVSNISGDRARVFHAVPAGANPHTFQPNPSLVKELATADAFIGIHPDFDGWIERFLPDTTTVLYLRKGKIENPHIWLSVRNVKAEIKSIADFLSQVDRAGSEVYAENAASYGRELETCDQRLAVMFSGLEDTGFIQWHPAWDYLASDYNLSIAGTMQSGHGDTMSVKKINSIITLARRNNIQVIVVGLTSLSKEAETLRKETDGRIIRLDAIGNPDNEETSSYVKLMTHNAEILSRALRESRSP